MKNSIKCINILKIDKEYDYVFSLYNKKLLTSYGYDVKFIDSICDVKKNELTIVPYILMNDKRFIDNLNIDCDLLCMHELPVIYITNANEITKEPSYNFFIFCVNNEVIKFKMLSSSPEDIYKWIKKNGYKVNTAFSNILVKEKMILCDVCYIDLREREKYKDYFKSLLNDNC